MKTMSSTEQDPPLTPILLPELGAGEEPIRVSTWLVEVEETVESGERLVDVLIPGVSFSVSSPDAGRLVKIERPAESRIKPGDILGWLESIPVSD
jgi:pyruvate/2-oxoglutarate dehydrogenase complex dihydrolipoamide acyltransferase (E2) component